MKTSKLKMAFFAGLLTLSFKTFAADVAAAVIVSPVGDFTAAFKDIDATAYADGDTYKASPFVIPWSKLSTGMSTRDNHAKKYFNAEKYPNIEVLESVGKAGKGVSKIKMNGVEKVVKGTYKIDGQNLIAEIPIKLSEFDVKDINFKGAGVKDDVNVTVTVPVTKAPEKAEAAKKDSDKKAPAKKK